MNDELLENFYRENLEERIIAYLAEICSLSCEKAMDLYYDSSLSDKIYHGKYGIQYLDYKVLAQMLLEIEKNRRDDVKRKN